MPQDTPTGAGRNFENEALSDAARAKKDMKRDPISPLRARSRNIARLKGLIGSPRGKSPYDNWKRRKRGSGGRE